MPSPGQTSSLASSVRTQRVLCEICQGIFTEELILRDTWNPPLRERYRHHEKARDLYEAARGGCHLCIMLWNRISNGTPLGGPEQVIEESMLEFITYGVSMSEDDFGYLINFIYKGNEDIFDYQKCHRLQICMLSTRGMLGPYTSGCAYIAFTGQD